MSGRQDALAEQCPVSVQVLTGWPDKHGRVDLVSCKKWLVQCTILYTLTLDKSSFTRYQKHRPTYNYDSLYSSQLLADKGLYMKKWERKKFGFFMGGSKPIFVINYGVCINTQIHHWYWCFALRSLNFLGPMNVRTDDGPHTKPLPLTQLRAL